MNENEWISVKDRLPDKEGDYAVLDREIGMQTYYYHPKMFCPNWVTVTHWMPGERRENE